MSLNLIEISRHSVRTVLLGLALNGAAFAQSPGDRSATPTIRAVADATVTARPDRVEVDLGVTTQAPTSKEAAERNATELTRVMKALESTLGTSATVKTIGYSLSPDYRHPKDGGTPMITGYNARNTVRVTLDDLERVGDAIDASTAAGANQVHRVHFSLKNQHVVQAEALSQAAKQAMSQVEAMASAVGVKIVRILSVTESQPVVRPYQQAFTFRAGASDPATPIQPKAIEVHATVTVTVEIAGRQSASRGDDVEQQGGLPGCGDLQGR